MLDHSAHEIAFAADQARLGIWPLAGGWLDQTQPLLEAVRAYWRDEARMKAHLGIRD